VSERVREIDSEKEREREGEREREMERDNSLLNSYRCWIFRGPRYKFKGVL